MSEANAGISDQAITVSVCIPVWNDSQWLPGAIDSVRAQTYRNWNLVVSDNASVEVLEPLVTAHRDHRVRFHRWPDHVGTYENHNRAVFLSSDPWIMPLGSDDRLAPDCLATVVERLEELAKVGVRPSMVVGRSRRVDAAGRSAERHYYGSRGVKVVQDGVYGAREWLRIMTMPGAPPWNIGSVAFSRRAIVDSGGAFRPEVGLSADNELVLRMAAYGPVAYVDRPLCDFTVRPDSDGNRRFVANRSSGEAQTPLGAALRSAVVAHKFHGAVGPSEERMVNVAIARQFVLRAAQHRTLPGGRGRAGAALDVFRAIRHWPGLLVSPGQALRAVGALVAPKSLLTRARSRFVGRLPSEQP